MEATAASALGSQPARHPEHDTHVHWIHGGSTDLDNLILLWGLLPKAIWQAQAERSAAWATTELGLVAAAVETVS